MPRRCRCSMRVNRKSSRDWTNPRSALLAAGQNSRPTKALKVLDAKAKIVAGRGGHGTDCNDTSHISARERRCTPVRRGRSQQYAAWRVGSRLVVGRTVTARASAGLIKDATRVRLLAAEIF